MKGVISTSISTTPAWLRKAKASPGLVGRDLVREVMPDSARVERRPVDLGQDCRRRAESGVRRMTEFHVVALDYGMKWNIARHLHDEGCRVTILPGTATAEEVLRTKPDGVFLSNGPGDPEPLTYARSASAACWARSRSSASASAISCLALACGAKTFKLKFGHRGANQPVLNCDTGKVEITSQNHGFAVDEDSLPSCLEVTHRNLNDNTIAGLRHKEVAGLQRAVPPRSLPPARTTAAICSGSFASRCRAKAWAHESWSG